MGDAQAGERLIRHQARAFPGEVIDQRQDTEARWSLDFVADTLVRPAKEERLTVRKRGGRKRSLGMDKQ